MKKRALIIGISGQDGTLLADFLIKKNYEVHGTSRDFEINSFLYSRNVPSSIAARIFSTRRKRKWRLWIDASVPASISSARKRCVRYARV